MKTTTIFFLVAVMLCGTVSIVQASDVDGTIINASAYAWGENIGWVNFSANEGNVGITDTRLTGYMWTAQYGWINLSPGGDFGGVTNDNEGNLGGYAWSGLLGPVSFEGVTINSSGVFQGMGGVQNSPAGRINFDCSSCSVQTDWRPRSIRDGSIEVDSIPSSSISYYGGGVFTGVLFARLFDNGSDNILKDKSSLEIQLGNLLSYNLSYNRNEISKFSRSGNSHIVVSGDIPPQPKVYSAEIKPLDKESTSPIKSSSVSWHLMYVLPLLLGSVFYFIRRY